MINFVTFGGCMWMGLVSAKGRFEALNFLQGAAMALALLHWLVKDIWLRIHSSRSLSCLCQATVTDTQSLNWIISRYRWLFDLSIYVCAGAVSLTWIMRAWRSSLHNTCNYGRAKHGVITASLLKLAIFRLLQNPILRSKWRKFGLWIKLVRSQDEAKMIRIGPQIAEIYTDASWTSPK